MVSERRPRSGVACKVPRDFAYEPLLEIAVVRSFMKSFSKESNRWNELVEATLCYGIHCLASNFSLHALRVQDIHSISGLYVVYFRDAVVLIPVCLL